MMMEPNWSVVNRAVGGPQKKDLRHEGRRLQRFVQAVWRQGSKS
jgi:hypothetical protein